MRPVRHGARDSLRRIARPIRIEWRHKPLMVQDVLKGCLGHLTVLPTIGHSQGAERETASRIAGLTAMHVPCVSMVESTDYLVSRTINFPVVTVPQVETASKRATCHARGWIGTWP